MNRGRIKSPLASLAHWTGADRLAGALTGASRVLVMGYHRVVESFEEAARVAIPSMLVSRAMLERHLDWVSRRYRFVALDELAVRLERGGPHPPLAALTFDDGYADVYEVGLPLLERMGIPATVFVVSELLGTRSVPLHDRLYAALQRAVRAGVLPDALRPSLPPRVPRLPPEPLRATALVLSRSTRDEAERFVLALERAVGRSQNVGDFRPLDWEMLADWSRRGHGVGSHTRTHALLPNESLERVRCETSGSRSALERGLGGPVRHFAYPDGRFDPEAVELVAESYRYAYTICRHRSARQPLLTIPRTMLWERSSVDGGDRFSPAVMSCHARGLLSQRCSGRHSPEPWARETAADAEALASGPQGAALAGGSSRERN